MQCAPAGREHTHRKPTSADSVRPWHPALAADFLESVAEEACSARRKKGCLPDCM